MTQLGLDLDRFASSLERIDAGIEASAERAGQAIKALAEHHRRSLGQIVRWQQQRAMEAARA